MSCDIGAVGSTGGQVEHHTGCNKQFTAIRDCVSNISGCTLASDNLVPHDSSVC